MKTPKQGHLVAAGVVLAGIAIATLLSPPPSTASTPMSVTPNQGQPSLTVSTQRLQPATMPIRVAANGSIMAWQEAAIGTEANGLRLAAVHADVGDVVRRGQPLATFAAETLEAELAQSRAAVAEAEVALAEAGVNAERALALHDSGALSAQQIQQYLAADRTAQARLDAARAAERVQQLRVAQTRVTAPDDGVIAARTATVGAVVPAGQALFRLIRGGRLEWHAEVAATELARLQPGQVVRITPTGGAPITGRLRMLAPVVDVQTRNALVYVDLPPGTTARAGMFARGEFEIGTAQVRTLPQRAVLLHEGLNYVMRIDPDDRVVRTQVTTGHRFADRVEILEGLDEQDRVAVTGAAFLGDGDLVRVVEEPQG